MQKRRAFTLIEMSMVLLAMSILLAGGMVAVNSYIDSARETQARSEIAVLAGAVARFHFETGAYPANLQALTTTNSTITGQPYILSQSFPGTDPWGRIYAINGNGGSAAPYAYAWAAAGAVVACQGTGAQMTGFSSGKALPSAITAPNFGVFIQ